MLEAGIVGLWLGQVECQVQQFQGPEEIQGGSGRGRGPFWQQQAREDASTVPLTRFPLGRASLGGHHGNAAEL